MIPETFGALLAFLGLVAPGLTFQLVLEKRRPRQDETTFRETSRVALSSLVFTLGAILLLFLLRKLAPTAVPDVSLWIKQGTAYAAAHLGLVFIGIAIEVVLACGLAAATAWIVTRGSSASISNFGAWYQIFREEQPAGTRPWIHLRLEDETEFWGFLRHYTPDDSADVREIVLGGTTLRWRRKGDTASSLIGDKWDAVGVNADRIEYIRVIYRSTSNTELRGRRTADAPEGMLRA